MRLRDQSKLKTQTTERHLFQCWYHFKSLWEFFLKVVLVKKSWQKSKYDYFNRFKCELNKALKNLTKIFFFKSSSKYYNSFVNNQFNDLFSWLWIKSDYNLMQWKKTGFKMVTKWLFLATFKNKGRWTRFGILRIRGYYRNFNIFDLEEFQFS
jgi:hypothetical protein